MNDEAGSPPGPGNNGQPNPSTFYAASGGLLRAAGQQPTLDQTDQLAAFVRQQPLTAALVALAIGYLLGKIS
jgi:hypothetical protein